MFGPSKYTSSPSDKGDGGELHNLEVGMYITGIKWKAEFKSFSHIPK